MSIDLKSLKKLKKPELLDLYLALYKKEQDELEKLIAEKQQLQKKCQTTLRLVANWENHKEILLQDAKTRFETAELDFKTAIAEECNFLREVIAGTTDSELKKLLESKIHNLEQNNSLVLMTDELFDPKKHIALGKEKNAEKIITVVSNGYLYRDKPLVLAKVLLD